VIFKARLWGLISSNGFMLVFYGVNLHVRLPNYVENASFVPLSDLIPHFKSNI
jgi:hypothetical protein